MLQIYKKKLLKISSQKRKRKKSILIISLYHNVTWQNHLSGHCPLNNRPTCWQENGEGGWCRQDFFFFRIVRSIELRYQVSLPYLIYKNKMEYTLRNYYNSRYRSNDEKNPPTQLPFLCQLVVILFQSRWLWGGIQNFIWSSKIYFLLKL